LELFFDKLPTIGTFYKENFQWLELRTTARFLAICDGVFQKVCHGIYHQLSADISVASGVPESGITVIWNTIPANHMITGGKLGVRYDNKSHPVLVEMDLAGFFTQEEVERVMAAIAQSFETHTDVDANQVFIITTIQGSGLVYVFGSPLKWDDGENPFGEAD